MDCGPGLILSAQAEDLAISVVMGQLPLGLLEHWKIHTGMKLELQQKIKAWGWGEPEAEVVAAPEALIAPRMDGMEICEWRFCL